MGEESETLNVIKLNKWYKRLKIIVLGILISRIKFKKREDNWYLWWAQEETRKVTAKRISPKNQRQGRVVVLWWVICVQWFKNLSCFHPITVLSIGR